ncbi:MAG: tetratricopeptide repeat protein [Pyrinomonadaceae bacterium]|nr:tetratricopeptide repeat protein [Pyrinomonadaceae bacterium]
MKRTFATKLAVIAFLLLLPASSSSAKENWIKVKSKNFTVIGNGGERDIRKLATKLEEFRHVLSLLFPKARIETPVPTTVFLFKSHASFKPFKPQYKGKTRENVGGYFLAFADGNYIALTSELGGIDPHQVIFHEYEHFVTRNNLPNAPPWLDEGLAEYFSTFTTSDDGRKASIGAPIPRHIFTLREGRFLPLDTLFKVNRKSPHYNESGKAGIFYAQSWALVQFLMLHNGGKRQPQLMKFIDGLSAGIPVEENFRQSFQADYKTIERELRSYLTKLPFPSLSITFPKQLDFAKDTARIPMPEAEVQYYLGDLLLRGRRFDEAEVYLKKSRELDANFTMSQISLGILRLGQNRLPEARKLLESAIASDSRNYLGHLHYAHVLSREERYEEAITSYQQAIQLKPEVAQSYSDLGYAYLNLGRDEDAVASFKQATRLDPRNPYLYRSRSYVYLRLARGTFAGSDARMYLRLQGWHDDHSPYMALALHFGLRQSKQATPASNVLAEAATKLTASEWPYPVIRYLQRQITAPELLALATDNDKLTEAHAYIGLDLSLSGIREEALRHLHWVRENGNKDFIEYPLALAEIGRITASGG